MLPAHLQALLQQQTTCCCSVSIVVDNAKCHASNAASTSSCCSNHHRPSYRRRRPSRWESEPVVGNPASMKSLPTRPNHYCSSSNHRDCPLVLKSRHQQFGVVTKQGETTSSLLNSLKQNVSKNNAIKPSRSMDTKSFLKSSKSILPMMINEKMTMMKNLSTVQVLAMALGGLSLVDDHDGHFQQQQTTTPIMMASVDC